MAATEPTVSTEATTEEPVGPKNYVELRTPNSTSQEIPVDPRSSDKIVADGATKWPVINAMIEDRVTPQFREQIDTPLSREAQPWFTREFQELRIGNRFVYLDSDREDSILSIGSRESLQKWADLRQQELILNENGKIGSAAVKQFQKWCIEEAKEKYKDNPAQLKEALTRLSREDGIIGPRTTRQLEEENPGRKEALIEKGLWLDESQFKAVLERTAHHIRIALMIK